MNIENLFIEAAFGTPDCPDLVERVSTPNAHIAKGLPRRVTDFNALSFLPFLDGCCDVLTRSNRGRIVRGIDYSGNILYPYRGDVLGFMPEHYVRLPDSARLNSHNLLVGKIGEFDYRIFATDKNATIEFPKICFPQKMVDDYLEKMVLQKINELEKGCHSDIQKTGKQYTYYLGIKRTFKADEYKIDNRFVAVVKNSPMLKNAVFLVKPIRYSILNYNDLPTFINPHGTGTAKAMNIASVNALMSAEVDDIWEFSRLRKFANSEFLKEINHSENENEQN